MATDPTHGQAVHFDSDAIGLFESIGLGNLSLAQINRIEEQSHTLPTFADFEDWCETMHDIKTGHARLIWDFYGDLSDEPQ
jgi:hypothetical protein